MSGTRKSNQLCIVCNEPFYNHERRYDTVREEVDEEHNFTEEIPQGGNERNVNTNNDDFTSVLLSLLSSTNQRNTSSIQGRQSQKQF
jgi:hypothetical protein